MTCVTCRVIWILFWLQRSVAVWRTITLTHCEVLNNVCSLKYSTLVSCPIKVALHGSGFNVRVTLHVTGFLITTLVSFLPSSIDMSLFLLLLHFWPSLESICRYIWVLALSLLKTIAMVHPLSGLLCVCFWQCVSTVDASSTLQCQDKNLSENHVGGGGGTLHYR